MRFVIAVVVNCLLPPLCSERFRPGKPSEQAQAATEMLNNIASWYEDA